MKVAVTTSTRWGQDNETREEKHAGRYGGQGLKEIPSLFSVCSQCIPPTPKMLLWFWLYMCEKELYS